MTGEFRERLMAVLPTCETLESAEIALKTPFVEGQPMTAQRAMTWGWFDGFKGRPAGCSPKGFTFAYEAAYKQGVELSLMLMNA